MGDNAAANHQCDNVENGNFVWVWNLVSNSKERKT